MKIVYIAHPISGNILQNLGKILSIVRSINLTRPDVVPLVPYFADILALDDTKPEERQRGINNSVTLFTEGIIDELWVYGNWENSKGCLAEIALAEKLNIPVHFKNY